LLFKYKLLHPFPPVITAQRRTCESVRIQISKHKENFIALFIACSSKIVDSFSISQYMPKTTGAYAVASILVACLHIVDALNNFLQRLFAVADVPSGSAAGTATAKKVKQTAAMAA
jgi:hypothetical protein